MADVAQLPVLSRKPGSADARPRGRTGRSSMASTMARWRTWLGFHLRMAQIASFQAFAREVGEVDLPPGRFALLTLIGRNPGISQTALSRAAGRDKSTSPRRCAT